MLKAVVVHIDAAHRGLHVLCPHQFPDQDAFLSALPNFIKKYRGEELPQWREFGARVLEVEVDNGNIVPAPVAGADALWLVRMPAESGACSAAELGAPAVQARPCAGAWEGDRSSTELG